MKEGIARSDLATQVYELLRKRISTLVAVPGQRIDIGALSDELSVSPIPIREALKQLVERQMVSLKPNVGYKVAELNDADIAELFSLRRLLELEALESSLHLISGAELKEIRYRCEALSSHSGSTKQVRETFCQTDLYFHQDLIVGRCGNSLLIRFYDVLSDKTSFTIHTSGRVKESSEEHLRIIDAMLQRDIDYAKRMLLEHICSCEKACYPLPQSEAEWIAKREHVFGDAPVAEGAVPS